MPDSPVARRPAMSSAAGYAMVGDKATDGTRQVARSVTPEQWQLEGEAAYARDEWPARRE